MSSCGGFGGYNIIFLFFFLLMFNDDGFGCAGKKQTMAENSMFFYLILFLCFFGCSGFGSYGGKC